MRVAAFAMIAAAAGTAAAQQFVDTFEKGTNVGNWTLVGGPPGLLQPAGGNPGWYFGGQTFNYPNYQTSGTSPFTGDYRERSVQDLRVDVVTLSHQGAIFPLTLMILTDNGTPGDPSDDWGGYMRDRTSQNVPNTGEGWRSFFFGINARSASPPIGWTWYDLGAPPPGHDWIALMRNVSQLRFLFAPPGTISNFPVWQSGIDNVMITASPPDCYANCDGSTTPPILNVNDFACFQSAFAAGSSYANCDQSTAIPVLTVNDFICFQSSFAACVAP